VERVCPTKYSKSSHTHIYSICTLSHPPSNRVTWDSACAALPRTRKKTKKPKMSIKGLQSSLRESCQSCQKIDIDRVGTCRDVRETLTTTTNHPKSSELHHLAFLPLAHQYPPISIRLICHRIRHAVTQPFTSVSTTRSIDCLLRTVPAFTVGMNPILHLQQRAMCCRKSAWTTCIDVVGRVFIWGCG
jgi:hypothetical protein